MTCLGKRAAPAELDRGGEEGGGGEERDGGAEGESNQGEEEAGGEEARVVVMSRAQRERARKVARGRGTHSAKSSSTSLKHWNKKRE